MCAWLYCICVCAQCLVCSLTKGIVEKNLLRRQEEPPCQLSCPEPAISSLFSLSPPCLPSSSAPLIGPLSGWWEDMLSSDGSAAQLTMLCVRARLRQGRGKNIPIRRGGLRVCECARWQVLEYQVLLLPQREHAKHRGEILINTDMNTSFFTTKWAGTHRKDEQRKQQNTEGRERGRERDV